MDQLPIPGMELSESYDFKVMIVEAEIPAGLPFVMDRVSLAYHIGTTPRRIGQVLHLTKEGRKWRYNKNNFYRTFEIPKPQTKAEKEAGIQRTRKIQAPRDPLKRIQRGLALRFWNCFPVHPCVTSYLPGVSIRDTAVQHYGADLIIAIDIKDFFPSIKEVMIRKFLERQGYPYLLARSISELCTFYNFLPQGSPCSPMLSNVLGSALFDTEVERVATQRGYHYTRYADDLIFSKKNDPHRDTSDASSLVRLVSDILAKAGFRVHRRKTKFMRSTSPTMRQQVLGLCVDKNVGPDDPAHESEEPFVRVSRYHYRIIRSMIHDSLVFGVEGAARKRDLPAGRFFASLQSYVKSFLKQCDTRRFDKLIEQVEIIKNLYEKETGGPVAKLGWELD